MTATATTCSEIYTDGNGVPRWSLTDAPITEQYPLDYTTLPEWSNAVCSKTKSGDVPKLIFYLGIFTLFCLIYGAWCLAKRDAA